MPQTRVYYLDSNNNLAKICWNTPNAQRVEQATPGASAWYKGGLCDAKPKIEGTPDSVIICAVTSNTSKSNSKGWTLIMSPCCVWLIWLSRPGSGKVPLLLSSSLT